MSLAELKKRQQQRRQQQQKQRQQTSGIKRKRDQPNVPLKDKTSAQEPQTTQLLHSSKLKDVSIMNYFPKSNTYTGVAPNAIGVLTASPFATAPREIKDNPFDIVKDLDASSVDSDVDMAAIDESGGVLPPEQMVFVGRNLSDSEDSDAGGEEEYANAYLTDAESDEEFVVEDPSLYRLVLTAQSVTTSRPQSTVGSSENENGDIKLVTGAQNESRDDGQLESPDISDSPKIAQESVASDGNVKSHKIPSAFPSPLSTLSLRTQVTVTSGSQLDALSGLKDDSTFLPLMSLSKPDPETLTPLNQIADALTYWEIISSSDNKPNKNNSSSSSNVRANGQKLTNSKSTISGPTAPYNLGDNRNNSATGGASAEQIQQALMSLLRLQIEAPDNYPYIYLVTTDYTVVFRSIGPRSKSGKHVRAAVISQSTCGLRRALKSEGIGFTLPLAPKSRTWNELSSAHNDAGGVVNAADGDTDKEFTKTKSVDHTWRSTLLVTGQANVNGLFSHLYSTQLNAACIYSTGPFLNGTLRRSTLRFSTAISYSNESDKLSAVPRNLYKMEIRGVILPSSWNEILTSLALLLPSSFDVSSKEAGETTHMTLLASRESNALAGKRKIVYSEGMFMYK